MHHSPQQQQQSIDYAAKYKNTTKRGIRKSGLTTRGQGSGIHGKGW